MRVLTEPATSARVPTFSRRLVSRQENKTGYFYDARLTCGSVWRFFFCITKEIVNPQNAQQQRHRLAQQEEWKEQEQRPGRIARFVLCPVRRAPNPQARACFFLDEEAV